MTATPKRAPALGDLTAIELKDGGYDTAVLPVGATEFHGAHLPFSTDTIAAETLAHRFAWEIGTAVVLPPVSYGMSLHMLNWPWSLSLRPETLTNVIIDIAESLLKHGLERLLVVTAHDGNPPCAENAARELNDRHGMAVAIFGGWQGMAQRLLAGTEFDIDEDHGGRSEMSMTLYAAPGLARQDRAVDLPIQNATEPVNVRGPFSNVVPHGYSGAPSQGSAAEGEAIVDALAAEVGPFLRNLAANGWMNGSWMSDIEPPAPENDPRHSSAR
ncbi:MAG: creatininase family protein [Thermomicrobiales bacterium]|nr:creatininase family protein [Thermomicrobiales bacterium]MCO5220476.1 creatininase family protein [Thermomicrobiales bacterium]